MLKLFRLKEQEKLSCEIESIEDLKFLLAEIETLDLEKDFIINLKLPNYDKTSISDLLKISKVAKSKGSSVEIVVNSITMQFKASELENFIDLEDVFLRENMSLQFCGGRDNYSLTETLSAQLQIDEIIDRINKTNASPFEKYLMAYNYVSSRVYKENHENGARSRDLIALFNGDDIVCVGYAKLMERICSGIGIECHLQASQISSLDGKELGGHQNNLIYLKDEKYGIDGYYYSDACWDAVSKNEPEKRTLNYCLIPLSDKDKFKHVKLEIDENVKFNDVSLKYFYSDIPGKYELLKTCDIDSLKIDMIDLWPEILDSSEQMLLNDKKRADACELLAELLKKKGVPSNVYGDDDGRIEFLPYEFNYEYILALLMEESPNVEEVEKCITALKKYSEDRQEMQYVEDGVVFRTTSDIYKKLEELSKAKPAEMVNSENTNEKIKMSPFAWRNIRDRLYEIKLAEGMVLKITNTVKPGDAITLDSFMCALKNMFIAQGYDIKTAERHACKIVDETIKNSEDTFIESAENSFRKELLKIKGKNSGEFGE